MTVSFEARGHVGIITIDRPEARNAIDAAVAQGIEGAVDRLEADPACRVGVLAGVPPVFCAGADLREVQAGGLPSLFTARGGFGGLVRRERANPLIAAVDGPAVAGGTELVLACDLVVASTRAAFGVPEVKWSLVAAGGGLFRLGRRLPRGVAMELALLGELLPAERAAALGLVNRLVEPGQALATAVALAEQVAANGPAAVQHSRRIVAEATGAPDPVGWEMSEAALAAIVGTEDFREGLRAFVEKRAPRWAGDGGEAR